MAPLYADLRPYCSHVNCIVKGHGCCPLMHDSSFFLSFIHSLIHSFIHSFIHGPTRDTIARSHVFRSSNTLESPRNEAVYLIISSTDIFKTNRNLLNISSLAKKSEKNDACSAGFFILSFPFQFNKIYFTLKIFLQLN